MWVMKPNSLIEAVRHENWTIAYLRLNWSDDDVMATDKYGFTALHWAAYHQNLNMVQELLHRNPHCALVTSSLVRGRAWLKHVAGRNFTALHVACLARYIHHRRTRPDGERCMEELLWAGTPWNVPCHLTFRTYKDEPFAAKNLWAERHRSTRRRMESIATYVDKHRKRRMDVFLSVLNHVQDVASIVDTYEPLQIVRGRPRRTGSQADFKFSWIPCLLFFFLVLGSVLYLGHSSYV